MAIKYEIYDGSKTYVYPNGKLATPEIVKRDFPAVDLFQHVIEVSGNVLQAVYELGAIKNLRGIPEDTDVADALQMMKDAHQASVEYVPTPTAEERIAAALEFSNLLSMEDSPA